jgi:hypothetical protein
MSNYTDYFDELASSSEKKNEIDFGSVINHKYNRAKRNYLYTHPNQLRTMTTHHNNKISHSKQNDLLGAIELLTYKPPPILPISEYQKQINIDKTYGSGKVKPFNISETENKTKPTIPSVVIKPKPVVKPPPAKPVKSDIYERTFSSDGMMEFKFKNKPKQPPKQPQPNNIINEINVPVGQTVEAIM